MSNDKVAITSEGGDGWIVSGSFPANYEEIETDWGYMIIMLAMFFFHIRSIFFSRL